MNRYPGRVELYHFDFYRIAGPVMAAQLGCEEYFGGKGISVVEWADRAGEVMPKNSISIEFATLDETTRSIVATFPNSENGK